MIYKKNEKKENNLKDFDSFWETDMLIPEKKRTKPKSFDVSVTETPLSGLKTPPPRSEAVVFDGKKADTSTFPLSFSEERGYSRRPRRITEYVPKRTRSETLVCSYTDRYSLIKKVSVYSWEQKYTFYGQFKSDAHKYFNEERKDAPFVPFYSYMPQYSVLSPDRLETYFAFRTKLRRGEYPETDPSYILLYCYEVINLPDLIPPEKALSILCGIWKHYRASFTRLDRLLCEWICDHCLVYGLRFPNEWRYEIGEDAFTKASLPEFYAENEGISEFSSLLLGRSGYNFRKSKQITKENLSLFETHVPKGFDEAINEFLKNDGRLIEAKENGMRLFRSSRDAYSGSICAYSVKRRIDLEYMSLHLPLALSFFVTDAVKFCENRVRSHLGIRSRLACPNLTEAEKKILSAYYDRELPAAYVGEKKDVDLDAPDEARPFSVSFENARRIEKESWKISDRLTEGIEFEEEPEEKPTVTEEEETLDVAKEALIYIASGEDEKLIKLANDNYMMIDTLIECVNEYCYEFVGDIAIEEKDGRYVLSDDYAEEIREWLKT